MRRFLPAAALLFILLAGCDSIQPTEVPTHVDAPEFAQVPGTGDPAIDALLQTFNNEVVACAQNGELERQTASRFALITAILRFTPTPDQKLEALVKALLIQIEHAKTQGTISTGCAAMLTGILGQI